YVQLVDREHAGAVAVRAEPAGLWSDDAVNLLPAVFRAVDGHAFAGKGAGVEPAHRQEADETFVVDVADHGTDLVYVGGEHELPDRLIAVAGAFDGDDVAHPVGA